MRNDTGRQWAMVPGRLVLPGPAHWRPAPEKIVLYAGGIAETFYS
jgi:hypothetical protein